MPPRVRGVAVENPDDGQYGQLVMRQRRRDHDELASVDRVVT
ncbi:MAG: hypothetical protein OXQ29_01975 [Rhodospirillaceae bacterium]|nr:hypothetical protein [Rhodospirillaceae bacterium]